MAKGRDEAAAAPAYMADKYAGVEASVHATWIPEAPNLRVVMSQLEKMALDAKPEDIVNTVQRALYAHDHRPIKQWKPQIQLWKGDVVRTEDGRDYRVTSSGMTGSSFAAKDDNQCGYEPMAAEAAEKAAD